MTVDFAPFAARMRSEQIPEIVIRGFERYYEQLASGETGWIREEEIEPISTLPDAEALKDELEEAGRESLKRTVVVKLNGGLGTSMGLERAKSLLEVKEGLTFLDIVAQQALRCQVPLVLMNSFSTRADSLEALQQYPGVGRDLPLDFMQHKVPKISQADLAPIRWPRAPELEWCPPGHGDIYPALVTSGMLDRMLEAGYERAFVSNADNLGAVIDPRILGYMVAEDLPFLMEVADRTESDRKGGHLARRRDGQLILRELAQCAEPDRQVFGDIERHRFFNTNNLWIDLRALKAELDSRGGILGLSMIRNSKHVDPRDPASPPVYQLETAMGAAVAVFRGAGAIRVPRKRFAPVKTTSDLLVVRSNAYILDEDRRIVPSPERRGPAPVVALDARYYTLIDELDARFPGGPPDLVGCRSLVVRGNVRFGAGVAILGDVEVRNDDPEELVIASGEILRG